MTRCEDTGPAPAGAIERALQAIRDAVRARNAGRHDPDAPRRLRTVGMWDGAWKTFDARRASLLCPACLVAVIEIRLAHRSASAWAPGQLRAGAIAETVAVAPQVDLDVAVTYITSDPDAAWRAASALALAEEGVPALIARGVEDVHGRNLYSESLYRAGLTAVALRGRCRVELAPVHPPRRPPARVDSVVEDGGPETVWEGPA